MGETEQGQDTLQIFKEVHRGIGSDGRSAKVRPSTLEPHHRTRVGCDRVQKRVAAHIVIATNGPPAIRRVCVDLKCHCEVQ